jgi:hypothetical protein
MTTKGPAQVWYVITTVLCTTLPILFLAMQVYTRLRIVKSLELVECKYNQDYGYCDS